MIVVAFSCAHLMGEGARFMLLEEGEQIDYSPIRALIQRLMMSPPDAVVNLGDFTEPVYDLDTTSVVEALLPEYRQLKKVTNVYELNGNHDAGVNKLNSITLDGVVYEHGNRLVPSSMSKTEEYIKILRRSAEEWGPKLVHGHSHYPNEGWPLDVGSITYSSTYGLIVDGEESSIIKIE